MANNRGGRINEEMMKALSTALRTVKDPRLSSGLTSVLRCEVTGDLRYAKVYITVLGSEEDGKHVLQGLKSASGYLRREVGQMLQLRYAPELIFTLDGSIAQGAHILELLHKDKAKHGGGQAEAQDVTEGEGQADDE